MKEIFKKIIINILILESRIILWRFSPYIIMVTGSVGKTSTKDAVYTALKSKFNSVRKSKKSQNSDIGVPLTILDLSNAWNNPILWAFNILIGFLKAVLSFSYPKYLVLEVGADKPNDLADLLLWIKPSAVVATRFPDMPSHVQFYSSPEAVIEEELLPTLKVPRDGYLIVNSDDERAKKSAEGFEGKILSYGLTPMATVHSKGEEIIYKENNGIQYPVGIKFDVMYKDEVFPFILYGVLGSTHIYPVLAGACVAISQGASLEEISKAFDDHEFPRGRMAIIEGLKGTTIIDDTYNSSPVAVEWALATLNGLNTQGRKFVALGDMRELGKYADSEHYKVGQNIARNIVPHELILVGPLSRKIAEGAMAEGYSESRINQFDNSRDAGKYLEKIIQTGDVVLAKGSQNTIRMEWLVEEIMAHPEDKEKLLVRQEDFWR